MFIYFFYYLIHETYKSVHNLELSDSDAFSPILITVKLAFNNHPRDPKIVVVSLGLTVPSKFPVTY